MSIVVRRLFYGDKYVSQAVVLLKDMVSIPTVNPPGDHYLEFANFAKTVLEKIGFDVSLIEVPEDFLDRYYPYAPAHRGHPRFIVYARYGSGKPVLHFNGHYDVVPPGSGWTRDPFTPVEESGRIYGRGTTDMKGGIAAFIAAAKSIIDSKESLRGTIEVALVPDEEAGGAGSRYFAVKRFSEPDYVILGEPTTNGIIGIGHKGMVRAMVTVYGKQVHGSVPWLGDNAFVKAAKVVTRFLEIYNPLLKTRRTSAPVIYDEGAHPTINIGGYAESTSRKDNIVPGEFRFSIDRRVIPEENVDYVAEELEKLFTRVSEELEVRLKLDVLSKVEPSLTPTDSPLVKAFEACVSRETSETPKLYLELGRNDAVYYTNILGSHAVSYGPGAMNASHTPDEYTTVEELAKSIAVYKCVIESLMIAN
ncbi:MAG: M20 family metallopeptidase [Sulfolobales archaeon]